MDLRKKQFVDAVFTSPERDHIEVIWKDSEEYMAEIVQVDPKNQAYLEVLELGKINFDDIIDMTAERKRIERRDFELSAIKIGQEEGWIPKDRSDKQKEEKIQIKTERQMREEIYKDISDTMFSSDIPKDRKVKEYMFMTKLYLFEHDAIKNSKDTKTKSALRKSKTPLEMMRHAIKLIG